MCEQFVARSDRPFRFGDLFPFIDRLERFGIAGFGWGATWRTPDGRLETHRDVRAFRDDSARERLAEIETSALLVHLRRPSRLSTHGLADTQPFADPAGRFAFSHNGDFGEHRAWRTLFRTQGRLRGRADSEVGARWLEDAWTDDRPDVLLAALHASFAGQANLAVLTADGSVHHYAGNTENPVFTFSLGSIRLASTGIYSLDRSVFRHVAPTAVDRRLVRRRSTASLA